MVAELTLFLTKDREVQVRAYKSKKGNEFYCVKDFIRQTASKEMGPDDAMIYWLSSLAKLMHEREIVDSRTVRFLGPYETPNICISAEGLLILYHHLGSRFAWVDEKYRSEVQNTLMDIIKKKSWEGYVEMHDDGEVEEQMAEGCMGCPPEGSKFHYKDEIDSIPTTDEEIKKTMEKNALLVKDLISKLEAKSLALTEANAKIDETNSTQERKKKKLSGFRISTLISEHRLLAPDRDFLCKSVVSNFRTRFPERETFMRHGAVHFFEEDKSVVEALVQEVYNKMMLEDE